MYIWPVQLPPMSNREDLLLTVAIFDDDTGDPVNLSGISLAVPGQPFTAAAWTVTDGAIVTNSATEITVPPYPVGGQLAALPLEVGIDLGILPGDPIEIVDTATGANSLAGYVISYVPATGALVVQIGWTFEFAIWRRAHHGGGDGGYSPFYEIGTEVDGGPVITASLGNGISIVDVGVVQVLIPAAQIRQLRRGTHVFGMNMTDSVNTRQVALGSVPILFGAVAPQSSASSSTWQNQF